MHERCPSRFVLHLHSTLPKSLSLSFRIHLPRMEKTRQNFPRTNSPRPMEAEKQPFWKNSLCNLSNKSSSRKEQNLVKWLKLSVDYDFNIIFYHKRTYWSKFYSLLHVLLWLTEINSTISSRNSQDCFSLTANFLLCYCFH